MTQEEAEAQFAEQRVVLASATCRLEFGFAFTMGGALETVRIFKQEDYTTRGGAWKTKHVQVGPMLVAPADDNTRAALLRQLADVLETV